MIGKISEDRKYTLLHICEKPAICDIIIMFVLVIDVLASITLVVPQSGNKELIAYAPSVPAKLFNGTGKYEKAVEMAKKVMIESTSIKEIKEELRKLIEKGDAEILNECKIQIDNNINPISIGTKERAYCSVVITCGFKLQKW